MATVLVFTRPELVALVPFLRERGFRVLEAHDSGHVLQVVLRNTLDALLLPDDAGPIEGEDMLPVIRRLTKGSIVVAGEGEETSMSRAFLQGADAYIKRPLTEREVLGRLHALLRRQDLASRPSDRVSGGEEVAQREEAGGQQEPREGVPAVADPPANPDDVGE